MLAVLPFTQLLEKWTNGCLSKWEVNQDTCEGYRAHLSRYWFWLMHHFFATIKSRFEVHFLALLFG